MSNNPQYNYYSPCAACKFLRRKCIPECIFAPYFPPDQPQKFAFVHRVYGASNVAKMLSEVRLDQREDAVNSLVYEAEARLRDPVYGCVGFISVLQRKLKQLQSDLFFATKELSSYLGQQSMAPIMQPHFASASGSSSITEFQFQNMAGIPLLNPQPLMIFDPQSSTQPVERSHEMFLVNERIDRFKNNNQAGYGDSYGCIEGASYGQIQSENYNSNLRILHQLQQPTMAEQPTRAGLHNNNNNSR